MSNIRYLEERIARLRTEAERCEDEDRWVDLHQEIDDCEDELRWAWYELEQEMEGDAC
ncbi:MAG: hypothetical protein J6W82_05155 [Bacteroidales bacterium]|nr:hypothetical protein [Bacteroidales bacterium]